MIIPNDKTFAFTILDDTDNATLKNVEPVYEFLYELGLRTTKSLWVYPPRDNFFGSETTCDKLYLEFLKRLKSRGFELSLHSVGSGDFRSQEIRNGFEEFKRLFGDYPNVHANHSRNPDNIYFDPKLRFAPPLSWAMQFFNILRNRRTQYAGEDERSDFFWGDLHKEHIKYSRSRTFNNVITSEIDKYMPYRKKSLMKYSNYWFSSSDGHTVQEFNDLISRENVDRLAESGGVSIIYTHFAEGFCRNGKLDKTFKKNLEYLASLDGYFMPVSEVLDLMPPRDLIWNEEFYLDCMWLFDRLNKRIKYGR